MSTANRAVLSCVLLAAVSALVGCGVTDSSSGSNHLTVFAAASLTKSFTELGARFEASHPGSAVDFSFAGSSDLVTQIDQGAPADVFASADVLNMTKAVAAKKVSGAPKNFAANTLTIVTAPGNPKHIATLKDLARPGLQVVLCAPAVPCGSAARKVAQLAGVTLTPVSEESAVTDVLGKVTSGQADAGLVYSTDAKVAGTRVTAVAFSEAASAVNIYPIAVLADSPRRASAAQFVDLVVGAEGRKVLAEAGFAAP